MKKQTLELQPAALSALGVWLNSENSLFSAIVESAVSNRQVLLIGHACLAFSALVCAASMSAMAALVMLLWFVVSLSLCKKGGIKNDICEIVLYPVLNTYCPKGGEQ